MKSYIKSLLRGELVRVLNEGMNLNLSKQIGLKNHAIIETELEEARRNPETNIDQPIYKEILDFVEKYNDSEGLIFVSFRNSMDVTFINPINEFGTPTGLYTYPWENYYKIKFEEQVRGVINPNLEWTVPFAGNRKYMFMYKLKSNEGLLTNKSTYDETLPYVKNLYIKFPGDDMINKYINNYDVYIKDYASKNAHYDTNLPPIRNFVILVYDLAISINKNKPQNTVSSIFRAIGVNGLVDFGTGFIHPNEKYQAVFFRERELMEDVKIIDLQEKRSTILRNLDKMKNIGHLELSDYEFKSLNPELQKRYALETADMSRRLTNNQFGLLEPVIQHEYAWTLSRFGFEIPDEQFKMLTPEAKKDYATNLALKRKKISDEQFKMLPQEVKDTIIKFFSLKLN